LEYFSKYQWSSTLRPFAANVDILEEDIENEIISFRRCKVIDNVSSDREKLDDDLFFYYACL